MVDFQSGEFFTFLCDDINSNQLYQFKYGEVAKGIHNKTVDLVFALIKLYDEISATFDNSSGEFSKESDQPLFLDYGFHYKNEVYYSMHKEKSSKVELNSCFNMSNAIWHSLCVLSGTRLDRINRELSDDQIESICINAKLILVEAYDGESYVFWKRNDFIIGELLEANFVCQKN